MKFCACGCKQDIAEDKIYKWGHWIRCNRDKAPRGEISEAGRRAIGESTRQRNLVNNPMKNPKTRARVRTSLMQNAEWLRKVSERMKRINAEQIGRPSWNKGKSAPQLSHPAWNKGLTAKDHPGIAAQAEKIRGRKIGTALWSHDKFREYAMARIERGHNFSRGKSGHYINANGEQVHYASSYEHSFYAWLDTFDYNWTTKHRIHIPYLWEGVLCNYLPDVFSEGTIYEVKACWELSDPKTQAKFEAAREWTSRRGLEFQIVTEEYLWPKVSSKTCGLILCEHH